MIYVKRWYLNNPLRNYNYLIVNSWKKTGLIVDPTLSTHYESFLTENGIQPEAILLTHNHHDHVAAAACLKGKYAIPVYGNFIEYRGGKVDYIVSEEMRILFATTLCQVIPCPGHIASHVSFYFPMEELLFCGDTIFTAGVGNVKDVTADVEMLYESIEKLKKLPAETKLYPAHDYFEGNLAFAQSIDSEDLTYKKWSNQVSGVVPEDKPITTLGDEREMNIFFRAGESRLRRILRQSNKQIIDARTAFCELRARKDVF